MKNSFKLFTCCIILVLASSCATQKPAKIEYRLGDFYSYGGVQQTTSEPSTQTAVIEQSGTLPIEDVSKDKLDPTSPEVAVENIPTTEKTKAEQVYKVSDTVGPDASHKQINTTTLVKEEATENPSATINVSKKTYTVKKGETLFSISRDNGVPILPIIVVNSLQPPYALTEGQVIKIPEGKYHKVAKDETLYSISRNYGVDMSGIVKLNKLEKPFNVVEGQTLQIPFPTDLPKEEETTEAASNLATPEPEAEVKEEIKTEEKTTQDSTPKEQEKTTTEAPKEAEIKVSSKSEKALPASLRNKSNGILGELKTDSEGKTIAVSQTKAEPEAAKAEPEKADEVAKAPVTEVKDDGKFIWPVKGKIVKKFGQSGGDYNDGINIAAASGTKVIASNPGRVVYTGNSLKSYGNLVIIKHDNGLLSAYAHLSDVDIKKDDKITKGQVIGTVGSTGKVTSPQLYFAIRQGKEAKDPTKYLPKA